MIFRKKKKEVVDKSYENNQFLLDIKPREGMYFFSDYYKVDDGYACIMDYFHKQGASDDFGVFWGVNKIPSGLHQSVVMVNFEQINRMTQSWIDTREHKAMGVAEININTQNESGNIGTRHKARSTIDDLHTISQELNNGASYLNVKSRLLIKAPNLKMLDDAVAKIERLYLDRFGTIHVAPYIGEQRQELGNLLRTNKRGKGFHFTSTEFAGSYSLVTHGLEDSEGDYVGYMIGDVNNSAVIFNCDDFKHHVVLASDQYNHIYGKDRHRVSDMWGVKLAQSALINNKRVCHIVLNDVDLDKLNPPMKSITYRLDMNSGDVNMFELFGDKENELSIFPAHIQKLVLMAEQAYETTDSDRSVIRGSLEDVLNQYYVDQGMWFHNAKENRDRLRIVGIPHNEVPKLETFVSYLDMEYKALSNKSVRDDEKLHAMSVLSVTFKNLLSNNGDLFNTITSDVIDNVKTGRRVIYDFSKLMIRGKGVAMAQLINIISYVVDNMQTNDLLLIHGVENIDDGVKDYLNMQFDRLFGKGARLCFISNSISSFIDNQNFNNYDSADYTILGNMTPNLVERYEKSLGQSIPPDLKSLISKKDSAISYIRRSHDNVVFHHDLQLVP